MSKSTNQNVHEHEMFLMGVECALSPTEVVEKYLFPDAGTKEKKVEPTTVSVRLYPGTLAELDRVAETLGVSRSRLMSEFLEGALAEALQYLDDKQTEGSEK